MHGFNPLKTRRTHLSPSQKFRFCFKKGSSKKFLWASRLWVGWRKEPIWGYVPKKNNLVHKGLNKTNSHFIQNCFISVIISFPSGLSTNMLGCLFPSEMIFRKRERLTLLLFGTVFEMLLFFGKSNMFFFSNITNFLITICGSHSNISFTLTYVKYNKLKE